MDKKIFYENVVVMRKAQKLARETNNEVWHETAARYEKIIDDEIERVQEIERKKLVKNER